MVKYVDATIGKVSDHIPDDLVFFVLSKLPLKSLKRFGCVRKSWVLLFENPHFMNMYRNNFISNNYSYYGDTSVLLQNIAPHEHVPSELYLLSGEKFENRVKLDWPPPLHEDDSYIHILGFVGVNGILCLKQEKLVVLWNPTTMEFKVLPNSPVESVPPYQNLELFLHGFGYDHIRDDYKVIRQVLFSPLSEDDFDFLGVPCPWDLENIFYEPLWEIYSLTSNSWRKLDVEMPSCIFYIECVRVYMDGVCHWWGENEPGNGVVECLVSFDFSKEVFFTTPMPSDTDDSFDFGMVHLVVLNGLVAFISKHTETTTTFHISILGELGVKESWTKLFIVGPLPCVERPIGVGKKGGIFFRLEDDELAWFDLSTQVIKEFGVKGDSSFCQIVIYKESLHLIGLEE